MWTVTTIILISSICLDPEEVLETFESSRSSYILDLTMFFPSILTIAPLSSSSLAVAKELPEAVNKNGPVFSFPPATVKAEANDRNIFRFLVQGTMIPAGNPTHHSLLVISNLATEQNHSVPQGLPSKSRVPITDG